MPLVPVRFCITKFFKTKSYRLSPPLQPLFAALAPLPLLRLSSKVPERLPLKLGAADGTEADIVETGRRVDEIAKRNAAIDRFAVPRTTAQQPILPERGSGRIVFAFFVFCVRIFGVPIPALFPDIAGHIV